tara:strand:+ start:115199 stop:115447 length:249 start_codon:yes stop_codon:yes gene_type:complete
MTMTIAQSNNWLAASFDGMRKSAASLWATGKDRRARRAAFRRTSSELNALSDRELADIGICRAEIHRVAMDEYSKDQNNEAY